jgi:hypothetical protein
VRPLTEVERALLHRLAAAGQPTELSGLDSVVGKALEHTGLVFFVRNSASAVITPKGRLLQEPETSFNPMVKSSLSAFLSKPGIASPASSLASANKPGAWWGRTYDPCVKLRCGGRVAQRGSADGGLLTNILRVQELRGSLLVARITFPERETP